MANPPRHFMAQTSCVIKSSPKEWDYEKDTINSLNSHPQLRSLGNTISNWQIIIKYVIMCSKIPEAFRFRFSVCCIVAVVIQKSRLPHVLLEPNFVPTGELNHSEQYTK